MVQWNLYEFPGAPRPVGGLQAADARAGTDDAAQSSPGSPPAVHVSTSFDGSFAEPVTATADEIRYAQELRDRLRIRYRERSDTPESPWCIGAD